MIMVRLARMNCRANKAGSAKRGREGGILIRDKHLTRYGSGNGLVAWRGNPWAIPR